MAEKIKVLVIEDDTELAEIEQTELEKAGLTAFVANDISSAKRKLDNDTFSCILLDLNLNGEPGKDLIDYIRRPVSKNSQACIFLVSGSLDIETVKTLKSQVQGVLVKPFRLSELTSKIKGVRAHKEPNQSKPVTTKKVKTVLIVDDDIEFCNHLIASMKDSNINVLAANNSTDALRKIQNQKFDCIVMDLDLGSPKGGDWIIQQVRKDKGNMNNSTNILVVSGMVSTNIGYLESIVQGFVEKPVSTTEFVAKVTQLTHSKAA